MDNTLMIRIKAVTATIRNKREYRNYTQDYLAFKLGISQNAYSKIELGYTKVTIERLFQIADVLEFDAADFINTDTVETKAVNDVHSVEQQSAQI